MKTNNVSLLVNSDFVSKDVRSKSVQTESADLPVMFDAFVEKLKHRVGMESYSSWFGRLQLESYSNALIRMSVPTAFLRSWINTHYLSLLEEIWREEYPDLLRIEIVVRGVTGSVRPNTTISDVKIPSISVSSTKVNPQPTIVSAAPNNTASIQQIVLGSPLDPKYTFNSFVEGTSNRMALAAARTVSEAGAGATRFNPLFIHASVGLGKTHLLQAIAASALSRSVPVKVVYFTAEYFMWRFAMAIRDNNALLLKEQLRNIDLLIIDDMQFLQGKSIQNEFCHLLNLLLDSAKQVIVAADRPVAELEMLDDRVKSRLQGGVALEIASPDYAMRLQMLHYRLKLASSEDPSIRIDDQLLSYVASIISGSGRDIEGAFNQLLVCQSFGSDLSVGRVGELLGHLMHSGEAKRIKIEDIQRIVARHYNVSKQDLLSNRRTRTIVKPRQIAMYLSKILTPRSLPEIGRRFGGRDHTTVLHAVRKIDDLLLDDMVFAQDIETLKQYIQEQAT